MTSRSLKQVLDEKTKEWMSIPGVVGTAIGSCDGRECIRVFTSKKPQGLHPAIPPEVEGYPVIIEQTGPFEAIDDQ